MSVRQVVRLRVVEKKAELFRFSDRALLFLFAKFFLAKVRQGAKLVCLFGSAERRNLSKFFFKVRQRARLVCLSASVEFSFREKLPSQSALVHKLMCSGFFICQNFSRHHQGRGVRNITPGISAQHGTLEGRIVCQKNMRCQQHPVFPGGHPSKY